MLLTEDTVTVVSIIELQGCLLKPAQEAATQGLAVWRSTVARGHPGLGGITVCYMEEVGGKVLGIASLPRVGASTSTYMYLSTHS